MCLGTNAQRDKREIINKLLPCQVSRKIKNVSLYDTVSLAVVASLSAAPERDSHSGKAPESAAIKPGEGYG
jgi:hypothetical protein